MNSKIVIIIAALTFSACNWNGAVPDGLQVDYEEVEELIEESPGEKYQVRGSCNTINDKSACMDYIGSFWTEEQMKLNCGSEGTWSKNTCPYSEVGGCRLGAGTMAETVIWNFKHGGQPFPMEALPSAQKVCNVSPGSSWVTSEDLYESTK